MIVLESTFRLISSQLARSISVPIDDGCVATGVSLLADETVG